MIAEDWSSTVFTYPNCAGFNYTPADHYMRNFNKDRCKESYTHLLEYFRQYVDIYDDVQDKFSITWIVSLAHDSTNALYHTDERFYQLFLGLKQKLDNSFLFVMGDHGLRFGKIRHTKAGKTEDNNPALFVALPRSLRSNVELKGMMETNSRQLITHHDLYATFLAIAKSSHRWNSKEWEKEWPGKEENSMHLPSHHGSSLFHTLKQPRNCPLLRIPFEYCQCEMNLTKVTPSNNSNSSNINELPVRFFNYLAETAVARMNEDLAKGNLTSKCSLLEASSKNEVELQRYQANNQSETEFTTFFMTFETIPEESSHKTVIVLDRSPKLAAPAIEDISLQLKDDQGGQINGRLSKTLWNCSVEAALEFHRVVADLFPHGSKQLRFAVSDFVGRFLTPSWSDELITYDELLKALSSCDVPQSSGDASSCSVLNGISMAVEHHHNLTANEIFKKLYKRKSEKTDKKLGPQDPEFWKASVLQQRLGFKQPEAVAVKDEIGEIQEHDDSGFGSRRTGHTDFANKGTIVVLTSIESLEEYDAINEVIIEQTLARNESIRQSEGKHNFLVIDQIHLIVINLLNKENIGNAKSKLFGRKMTSILNSSVHKALQDVYDLVSTTVSGIPMKEEAHQGQSVNYDVELLHSRHAHQHLLANAGPKLKSEKFPLLQNSFLLTPAYVNSRPTVCLTSFVLSGKTVMLEVERELAPKQETAHIGPNLHQKLICHSLTKDEVTGALIVQSVAIGNTATLDGALTANKQTGNDFKKSDINYTSMVQLMNASSLVVVPNKTVNRKLQTVTAVEKNRQAEDFKKNIWSLTEYFPTSLRESFILNMPEKFEVLFSTIQKPVIGAEDFDKCKKYIYGLIASRNGNETFTLKNIDCIHISKITTRDEQFRIAFEELVKMMKTLFIVHLCTKNCLKYLKEVVEPQQRLPVKRALEAEKPRNTSRSNSPLLKKAKKCEHRAGWAEKKSTCLTFTTTSTKRANNLGQRNLLAERSMEITLKIIYTPS
uniref:Protein asunder n=1 Tax=Ditylenchus dipsaci TaxID=166011 RepID=A0A915DLT0_9BILA